ncbi:MAG: hypothetical protein H6642_09065 [Caldilineaceae bacterium]|nr:hypothetical protein [Caldilineaceae bacterium]
MPASLTPLIPLLSFLLALLILFFLARQISFQLQELAYLLTGSEAMMTLALYLLFLPGIIVHEGAHWLMARALGLKAGKFRVWPKRKGNAIGMGSVSVQRGGVWKDSLVGLAPLLAGTALVAFIGHQVFAATDVTGAWAQGDWSAGLHALARALRRPDGALWAYALFVVANAMMPSASDREPLRSLLLYSALAGIVYLVLGLPATPFAAALAWSAPFLRQMNSALLFTILLDGVIVASLSLLVLIFAPRGG